LGLDALGVPLGFLVAPVEAGWLGGGVAGRAAGVGEQRGPAFFPGPAFGQVQSGATGRGGDSRRNVDEFSANGRGDGFSEGGTGEGAGGAGEVERNAGQHEPGRVGGEHAGRYL